MTFSIHGLPVARGIAIGRAVLVVSSRIDVAHYFIKPEEIETEIDRVRIARNAVAEELQKLQASVALMGPNDAPHELAALLEVHQMLLQDEVLTGGVKHWIVERLYNAEWALTTQLEVVARQFDEMEDEYLRERKADLEQVVERLLHRMKGTAAVLAPTPPRRKRAAEHDDDAADPTAERRVRRAAGADRARPVAGRHAAVQEERVRRLRDRRRRPHLAHRDRCAQHGHPGRGRRPQRQPAGAAGRLGDHRRRCRRDDRRPVADHPGRVRLQAAPGRPRARAAFATAPQAGRHARRPARRPARQHRDARGHDRRREGRRGRRGPVPQRVPLHGPRGAAPDAPARRGRAVPGLPARRRGHAGHAGDDPHHRRRRRQAARRQVGTRGRAPEPGAGPARDPLEPGRPGDVPDAAARHPARRRARRDPPADPDARARAARSARRCR